MKDHTDRMAKFLAKETSPETKEYVALSMDVAIQISKHLKDLGLSQKDFANKLGKSEPEISKWLSGMHNFTLKSIAKIQAVLGRKVITTPASVKPTETIRFVQVNVERTSNDHKVYSTFDPLEVIAQEEPSNPLAA